MNETDGLSNNGTDSAMNGLLESLGATQDPQVNETDPVETDPVTGDNDTDDGVVKEADAGAQGELDTNDGPDDDASVELERQKANEAFAKMRTQLNSQEKLIKNLMKASNFTGTQEEFMEQLTDAAYQRQAQAGQTVADPALLKKVDQLVEEREALIESQNKQMFMTNLERLQNKFELSQADLNEFVRTAVDQKINLTIPGTDFSVLYQGMFFDKITAKKIESERQKWIAGDVKAGEQAADPKGKSGKKETPEKKDVNTQIEFNSLLANLPK